ncbi:hypothetical protein Aperf_G00000007605 [Anoplocephala perfoliata]
MIQHELQNETVSLKTAVINLKPELIVNFATDISALNQPDSNGSTPLHYLAWAGSTASVYVLFAYGCDLNPLNQLNRTPLMTALASEQFDTARMLLFLGASPFLLNPAFQSALTMAIEMNDRSLVSLMLIQPCLPELRVRSLYVALAATAAMGRLEIALMLLEAGASLSYFIDGITPPLNISAALGNLDMVKIWIEHGAPLERLDKRGLTPLMNAAENGHLEICETLIKNGTETSTISLNFTFI